MGHTADIAVPLQAYIIIITPSFQKAEKESLRKFKIEVNVIWRKIPTSKWVIHIEIVWQLN